MTGSGRGQFNRPEGIDIDSTGRMFVSDSNNDRVQVFDATGSYLFEFGDRGSDPGELRNPEGINVDLHGNVYVADSENHRYGRI